MPNIPDINKMQMMGYMNAPPDIQAGASEIFRQQQLADLLRKQAIEPIKADEYSKTGSGQWAAPPQIVPVGIGQGLAKMGTALVGGYMDKKASEDSLALANKLREAKKAHYSELFGSEAVPGQTTAPIGGQEAGTLYTDDYTAVPATDQQGYKTLDTPATPGLQGKDLARALAKSWMPEFEKAGLHMMTNPPKPEQTIVPKGGTVLGPDGKPIFVSPEKVEYESMSNEEKLVRSTLLAQGFKEGTPEWNAAAAPMFNKLMDKKTNITVHAGVTDKVPMGYRKLPNGNLEAIPGGPADLKATAEATKKAEGTVAVDTSLATLRDAYNRLEAGGGITSTENGPLDNAGASIASSGIGQATGKLFGTKNQSARNDIAMARPGLLAALMKATGMNSKQMDSNAELKLWLATATDPTLDVESNRKALDNIERKYINPNIKVGSSSESSGKIGAAPSNPHATKTDAQIKAELGL